METASGEAKGIKQAPIRPREHNHQMAAPRKQKNTTCRNVLVPRGFKERHHRGEASLETELIQMKTI
eukprot:3828863-Prymnesium_polylepis.1